IASAPDKGSVSVVGAYAPSHGLMEAFFEDPISVSDLSRILNMSPAVLKTGLSLADVVVSALFYGSDHKGALYAVSTISKTLIWLDMATDFSRKLESYSELKHIEQDFIL